MVKLIYFKSTDEIFRKFENYEIWPCAIVGKDNSGSFIYETCNFDDPDIAIWCVYGHFHIGGLECISDHNTLEEAEEFERTLPARNFWR
jgi:hypothetical protein